MKRSEILQKAQECTCGQREKDYGTPEENFERIARYWSAYLGHHISPVDVTLMMILFKIARSGGPNMTIDTFIDIAGYAACGGEMI